MWQTVVGRKEFTWFNQPKVWQPSHFRTDSPTITFLVTAPELVSDGHHEIAIEPRISHRISKKIHLHTIARKLSDMPFAALSANAFNHCQSKKELVSVYFARVLVIALATFLHWSPNSIFDQASLKLI